MVEQHIVDFLDMKGEAAGLGFFSEQAMESVHHDFKVNNIHRVYCGLFSVLFSAFLGESQGWHRPPRVWCQA